jgi:hypothetical protein
VNGKSVSSWKYITSTTIITTSTIKTIIQPRENQGKNLTIPIPYYGVGLRPLACWDCGFESLGGMDVWVLGCVLTGRGFCVSVFTGPEESYRLWCV